MPTPANRPVLRRAMRLALAGMTIAATIHTASANDGIGDFFSSIFGGGASGQQSAAPAAGPSRSGSAPTATYGHSHARPYSFHRPLTVRLHKAAPKVGFAQVPTKPETVSIFEDRTLKRGDVVMTAKGIRIFAGSASFPYTGSDFIDLAAAKDLKKDTAKALAEVDNLPRG